MGRRRALAVVAGTLLACASAVLGSEAAMPAGRYRLVGQGPDVASELILRADGSFEYFLAAGALDEHAAGRWTVQGRSLRLTTVPTPVPPVFSAGAVGRSAEAPLVLHVTGPEGGGIAGVDVRVGFDAGEPVEGYTQDYGWALPDGETRTPRWVEFAVPMYQLRSQRFAVDPARGNALTFVLTPNGLGEIDFAGMSIETEPGRLVVHRGEGRLVYEAVGRGRYAGTISGQT